MFVTCGVQTRVPVHMRSGGRVKKKDKPMCSDSIQMRVYRGRPLIEITLQSVIIIIIFKDECGGYFCDHFYKPILHISRASM